jgi:hypothetical protein
LKRRQKKKSALSASDSADFWRESVGMATRRWVALLLL